MTYWQGFRSQKDDIHGVFQKMYDSDAIIGFPSCIGRESSQLCTFSDRCYSLLKKKLGGTGKRGMVIGTRGAANLAPFDSVVGRSLTKLFNWVSNLLKPYQSAVLKQCATVGMTRRKQ